MAYLTVPFVLSSIVVLYCLSFVFFAVIRILTGVSIQRIGYFSLRRLAITPKDGIKVEVRRLGLNIHRPTFAQPTWLSLVLSELVVTVDLEESSVRHGQTADEEADIAEKDDKGIEANGQAPTLQRSRSASAAEKPASKGGIWHLLTDVKERIKKLHRKIKWLRLVDVVATNSTLRIVDVGNLQIGSFTIAVDTRRKTVDRARFHFLKPSLHRVEYRQAEWILTVRHVLFTANGHDSLEILNHALLSVHGFLCETRDGLRDAEVALKAGHIHIPLDEIDHCSTLLRQIHANIEATRTLSAEEDASSPLVKRVDWRDATSNHEQSRNLSVAKHFLSSILHNIKEVQLAVSYIGLSQKIPSVRPAASPMSLSASMKELGVDLHRLDPKSPAHRMYFPSKDIAHEALAAALSISVGLDDVHGKPERLLDIPMATITVRTTLPSKSVASKSDDTIEEKNANILFANSVITSPSVDLDPWHLPLIIALLQPKPKIAKPQVERRSNFLLRLLPKANVKFSMHEPVVRIKLKPLQSTDDPDDFDLIISSISSASLDMESCHSALEDFQYSLNSALRLQSHRLYYQTCIGEIFNLITADSFDVKTHLAAKPDLNIDMTANLSTFSISMVRPEITDGLRQIVRQLRIDVEPEKRATSRTSRHPNFMRFLPSWLIRCHFQATDFDIEAAGTDEDISDKIRGVSLHLDHFSAEYRAYKFEGMQRRLRRRHTLSRPMAQSETDLASSPASGRAKRPTKVVGDGRRLVIHARGLETQILEAADRLELEPFVKITRLELATSVTSDSHGPIFHVQSSVQSILVQYSLFRHYSVGMASMTLRKAFLKTGRDLPRPRQQDTLILPEDDIPQSHEICNIKRPLPVTQELLTVDFKASLVQIKAQMPQEPQIMLHVYGIEAGRHRWSTPYLKSSLVRLYAAPPRIRNVWAKTISIKNGRVDLRKSKHKTARGCYAEESLIDVTTEAIRVTVPYELIVSQITENVINVLKAIKQLHHRFKTGTNEYVLDKKPEAAKKVPKISLRARNFLFEMEDGAFEWKLGIIYRTGRMEQGQRLAREQAFRVKASRVHDETKRGSKARSRSAMARGRTGQSASAWFRSRSLDNNGEDLLGSARDAMPRYDPDGESLGVNGRAKLLDPQVQSHLDNFNAQSWKRRIDRAYKTSRSSMTEFQGMFWGPNHLPDDVEEHEKIIEVPQRPPLMSATISDLTFLIDKPTFAMKDLPDFIHKAGKGMPRDMAYTLLIPMHISIGMGEARFSLRDYPLPFLHIPALKPGQSSKIQSVSIKSNFVIAEEFRGIESVRRVRVCVIPPKNTDPTASNEGSFAIEVQRTISPIKSYSDVYMDVNTVLPTRITWGPCYQPAVQEMMMVVESFTKPQMDPSEKVGFWDKLRLNTHSRVHIAWKGNGDMHLSLKGTRDPYQVIRNGAGFLMCWRNGVKWNINVEDDPKQFMTVDSGEYILAIPDYSHLVREAARRSEFNDGHLTSDTAKSGAVFKKVIMKLSGRVQWMVGLVFERATENCKRSFDFMPHYDVIFKNPAFAKPKDGLPCDAMKDFRSRHIHLSIGVRAPVDRAWTAPNPEPSRTYNSVHLTPRFFTHFFTWWALFSQPMSLPIRQGNLFPGREKNSKKFGRHLATIKYNLLLAPLFLSHIYKHKDAEEYSQDAVSATGLKVRFDSFRLDLHQRREEFDTLAKGGNAQSRTSGVKIHAAQLDLASIDVRAVSASLRGTTTESIQRGSLSALITEQDEKPDLSKFTIPDKDYRWIDMDDFVELDWILPTEPHPNTRILPLAYAPRMTYFRQTDIGGTIAGDPSRTSPFGDESTHNCIMTHDDAPKRIQARLIRERLEQLEGQMLTHSRIVGEAELKLIQTDAKDPEVVAKADALRKHTDVLKEKKVFLEKMLEQIISKNSDLCPEASDANHQNKTKSSADSDENIDLPAAAEFESEFKNRFVVHNMQLKWNNLLRNIVLRYIHQNSQRRGFIYYLSRPAVKFILDIVEEQNKVRSNKPAKSSTANGASSSPERGNNVTRNGQTIEERIKNILDEGRQCTNAKVSTNGEDTCAMIKDLESGISEDFVPQRSYHLRLIAPQIQLQSDKNKKHVVLVTAKGMELKVLEIMDKMRISDVVSGLVQHRLLVNMDSTQIFGTHQKWFLTNLVSMYAGSTYGTPTDSSWPPWVPMEVMYNFSTDPFGFKRIVQKTSAMLRYDKFNNLRLKYNDEVSTDAANTDVGSSGSSSERRVDNLWVEFHRARALCNSSQYYAMYVIVLDLLMYSEPLEKTRSERLEKIMLASDFSDLSGAPQRVHRLQERIRQQEDIKTHFQIYSKYLDHKGWENRLALERGLAACEDELFFMMKAITTSQRKMDSKNDTSALLKWSLSAQEIVWHLMQDSNEPLVELQLKGVQYDRTDNSDGSHMNLIRVGKVLGLNLLSDATYPEIIAPYAGDIRAPLKAGEHDSDMIRVYWYMLEAIAGISVMESFEVKLFPMKIQLEREAGKRIFEYIFPGLDGDKFSSMSKDQSSYLIMGEAGGEEEEEEEEAEAAALAGRSNNSLGFPDEKHLDMFPATAGALEHRLRPTLTSNTTPERVAKKATTLNGNANEGHTFRLFRSSGTGKTMLSKKSSHESLRVGFLPHPGTIGRSSTGVSSKESRGSTNGESKKNNRFGLRGKGSSNDKRQSDDLTKMITRASSYMTFAYIKIPSVVLCLSYKGKDQRNFEDLHNFVFRLPMIEWQNKTWSNLDLALALKKAVVKALISHTGAIIGNKISKHRPNAEQRSKQREQASHSALISTGGMQQHYAGSINDSDESSSLYMPDAVDYSQSPPGSARDSRRSSIPAPRSSSRGSSVLSGRSHRSGGPGPARAGLPSYLTMTASPSTEVRATEQGRGNEVLGSAHRNGTHEQSSHRSVLRYVGGGDGRPLTGAGGSQGATGRRRPPVAGLKEKFNALTHRKV